MHTNNLGYSLSFPYLAATFVGFCDFTPLSGYAHVQNCHDHDQISSWVKFQAHYDLNVFIPNLHQYISYCDTFTHEILFYP